MSDVPLHYCGVRRIGQESFCVAILQVDKQQRIMPIWVTSEAAAEISSRGKGEVPRRPGVHDVLHETMQLGGGLERIRLGSVYNGVFMAVLELHSGATIDVKLSDAIVLSLIGQEAIWCDEALAKSQSVYIGEEDLEQYLAVELDVVSEDSAAEPAAEGSSGVGDADFEQMMRDLGVSESDLRGDNEDR